MESEEDWSTDEEDLSDDVDILTMQTCTPDSSSPVWQLVFFLLLWQSLYKISNAAISGLLRFFKAFAHFFSGAYAGLMFWKLFHQVLTVHSGILG